MISDTDYLFLENWMDVLKEDIATTKLRDLKIPATHDSNTYVFSKYNPVSPFARCQSLSIKNQLKMGVRMLDLRYGPNQEVKYIEKAKKMKVPIILDQHGPLSGGNFLVHIEELKNFVENHPNEFIILNIQWEKKTSISFSQYLIEELLDILGNTLIDKEDIQDWFKIENVTFGEILARKKRILLIARPSLWDGTIYDELTCAAFGIHSQEPLINSTWHDVGSANLVFQKNLTEIDERDSNPNLNSKLLVSQILVTLQGKLSYFMGLLCTGNYPSIYLVNKQLYQKRALQKFIFLILKNRKGNILMFDFIEEDINLIIMLVASNGKSILNVMKFMWTELVSLDYLTEYMLDNKLLYIPKTKDLSGVLGQIESESLFVYSFLNKGTRIKTFGKNDACLIYQNPYREKKEIEYYCYFVFLKSGKFDIKTILKEAECGLLLKNLKLNNNSERGFLISGLSSKNLKKII